MPLRGKLPVCVLVILRFAFATFKVADAVLPFPPFVDVTAPVVLLYVPATELVTFTLNVQETLAAMVAPVRVMLFDPATAVTIPPAHPIPPVNPFGVATTRLAGSVSVNPTPVSATVFAAGLVMVKLRAEVPVTAIAVGLNAFAITGGATTKMEAEAVPPVMPPNVPVPSSNVAVTWPLTLFLVPALVPVTSTDSVQELLAGSPMFVMLMVLLPAFAVTEAPSARQVPATFGVAATTSPAGSVSVKLTLTNGVIEVGLVKVNVSVVLVFSAIEAALNALATVGGAITSTVAVLLVAPGPLSLAEIGPVVLFLIPIVVA